MANVTVQARVSPKLKQEAETAFSAIGMTTKDITRFMTRFCIQAHGLIFP